MGFKAWINENHAPSVQSKEELSSLLKDPQSRELIIRWAEEINRKEYGKRLGTANPVLLYHGSPVKDIGTGGFKVTKGQRSLGFLGARYEVENQGIFMTDSKPMANYYGDNRATNSGHNVYSAYANLDNVLDATTSLPVHLRKMGLEMINNYENTRKTKLAERDLWWLLDRPKFVDAIKQLGYTAVKFKESYDQRRKIDANSHTYLIFDPKNLIVKSAKNDLIHDFDTLWQATKKAPL